MPLRWLYAAGLFHACAAIVLLPVTSHPYDLVAITGPAEAWLRWGVSPLLHWKFGFDYAALALGTQFFRAFLAALGTPGIVAVHVAWKLPLVAADFLAAGSIYRLGLKLAPGRAESLAVLWLLNPVPLWVSAGHGQVESIAVLCIVAALVLALEKHPILAGLVTGLGVGIEYVPLVAFGAILVWWRGGYLPGRRPLIGYCIALIVSLGLCFVPIALDPVGRMSLVSGLASSSGLNGGPAPATLLTVWAWVGYAGANSWPIVFGAAGLVCTAVALIVARRSLAVAPVYLSVVLIMAVLLDQNALPQFAVVALAALILLGAVLKLQPVLAVALPSAGLATYFLLLYGGNANAFFYDDWTAIAPNLWPVPQSAQAAEALGRLFSIGLASTAIFTLAGLSRAGRSSWRVAEASCAVMCAVLVAWVLQPAIWAATFSSPPSASARDFYPFIGTRQGTIRAVGTHLLRVRYPTELLRAAAESSPRPSGALEGSVADLFDRESVGGPLAAAAWPNHAVTIPQWHRFQPAVSSLWIELLLGSYGWPRSVQSSGSIISLNANGTDTPAARISVVTEQGPISWALVDFKVPVSVVALDGTLDIMPTPDTFIWNGSSSGPWVRILPAEGSFQASEGDQLLRVNYAASPTGSTIATGIPAAANYELDLSRTQLPFNVQNATLLWPDTPAFWMRNAGLLVLGLAFGAALVSSSAWGLLAMLRPAARHSAVGWSMANEAANHWVAK